MAALITLISKNWQREKAVLVLLRRPIRVRENQILVLVLILPVARVLCRQRSVSRKVIGFFLRES